MKLLAAVLFASAIAQAASPVLAISIDHAISRPGRNGRGIDRPLFLIVYKWRTDVPEVKARSFSGNLTATCKRLPSADGQWKAEIQYEARQDNEPAYRGTVKLDLTIDDAIVRGTYDGSFNGTAFHGRPGAGLAFERDYELPSRGLLLWMPHLGGKLRAVLFIGNGGEGEKREAPLVEATQAFAAAHNMAVIGTAEFSFQSSGPVIVQALRDFAKLTDHAELEQVPIFFMGHSGGGIMSASFNQYLPSRVGGYISSHGGGPFPLMPAARQNPGVYTAGENDPKINPLAVESLFVSLRTLDAKVSLVVEQGGDHPMGPGAMPLYLYSLERLMHHRLPAGASELKPVDDAQAWVADNATWKHGITRILSIQEAEVREALTAPPPDKVNLQSGGGHVNFAELPLKLRLSWLLDKDVAFVYRGIATYSNPLTLARADDHAAAYLPGETVRLTCTDFGGLKWKAIHVYDGSVLLGDVTPARPQLTLSRQSPGAHAGVLVGELPSGELRTSLPVLWSVWPE